MHWGLGRASRIIACTAIRVCTIIIVITSVSVSVSVSVSSSSISSIMCMLIGGAHNALKFQCAQRDSVSELLLEEKAPRNQCEGKSPRDPEKLWEVLLCACARESFNQAEARCALRSTGQRCGRSSCGRSKGRDVNIRCVCIRNST